MELESTGRPYIDFMEFIVYWRQSQILRGRKTDNIFSKLKVVVQSCDKNFLQFVIGVWFGPWSMKSFCTIKVQLQNKLRKK